MPSCGAAAGLFLLLAAGPAAAAWRDLQTTEPPPPAVSPAAFEPEASVALPVADGVVADDGPGDAPDDVVPADGPDGPPAPREDASADRLFERHDGDPTDGREAEPLDVQESTATRALRNLTRQDLDIRVEGLEDRAFPREAHAPQKAFEARQFAATTFTWKAAGNCHKPLYFEHAALERYGHSHGFVADSFLSAAHFFGRLPTLPYQMGVELPWECVYPLGYYRPGSCAPWTVPAVPVSGRGLVVGAAAATGIVFLLP